MTNQIPEYPLFDMYFDYIGKAETPATYVRWAMMSGIGAALGRRVYFPFGDFRIFPNLYVMFIGDPGVRKSTAIKQMRKILSSSGYTTFAGDKTSKEKFLIDLEGEEDKTGDQVMETMFGADGDADPKEMYIVADEFNEFAGTGNLDFLSLLGSLWDWDDPSRPFEQKFKNSKSLKIWQPTISLIGGNTHVGLAQCFPPQAIGQGFMSRMLFIFAESSGTKIAFPTRPPDELRLKLADAIMAMRDTMQGEMQVAATARQKLEVLYHSWQPLDDARFQHYSTRRFQQLLKICTICAAARFSMEINDTDVIMANTVLSLAEHRMPQALGEYGKSRNADVAGKVMSIIMGSDGAVPVQALWTQVSCDLEKMDDLMRIMAGLMEAGKVQFIATENAGERGYAPVRKVVAKAPFTRFDWLREFEESKRGMH
jgi:Protein of unknown function (DUF3987)